MRCLHSRGWLDRCASHEAAAGLIEGMAGRGECREGARDVAAYLRRHAGRIGRGPSMGTTEAERQHVYKVRMGSFPCAWPPEGADAMARVRSWLLSGFGLPRGAREGPLSEAGGARGREAREARVLAARKPCTIRGEGAGVPPRRLGGRAGLRRQVQGVRRRPLGSSANINLMPTEEVHQDDAHDEDGYGGRRDAAQEELIVLQDVLDHAVVSLSFGFSF